MNPVEFMLNLKCRHAELSLYFELVDRHRYRVIPAPVPSELEYCSVVVWPITRSFQKKKVFLSLRESSLTPTPPTFGSSHPAAMDDDIEVIYSTPLPGASSTPQPHHAAASSPPHVLLHSSPLPPPPPPPDKKPADYVYYERRPDDLSSDARARATAAKVKLQSHYRIALETAIDLNVRCAQRCFYSVFRLSTELLLFF